MGAGSEGLALLSPCHGASEGHERGAAAPGLYCAVAFAARCRDGRRVQVGDGPLGREVAGDPAAAGGKVGTGRALVRAAVGALLHSAALSSCSQWVSARFHPASPDAPALALSITTSFPPDRGRLLGSSAALACSSFPPQVLLYLQFLKLLYSALICWDVLAFTRGT